ncbi:MULTISPECIES: threonine ammonia-lyase [unclassified Methanoregula]|uniref:threonine ammonia-lyase n=1 Tax=unclassified Methanoregula TaxID=2649730 RepID=UPI0009C49274|nr:MULTISPECIES: threonine ammonia-lyase [unclassified Methanoregula]OPX63269.1 MAG: Threonine synthase [Methanoregula sp. PtaB.Bin085]OPY34985.1 MAG: Threonine synthase [Methanoregula sp. PtaU1.Bin006]
MVSLEDIRAAETRIAGHIIRTPLVYSPTLSERTGARVYLKLEMLQKAGSFKVRGATNTILSRIDAVREHGVVAASAGNHAQGVAVAAHAAGVRATIVMPSWASIAKQEATRGYGAEVLLHGSSLEESIARAGELARGGMLFIHPYDDDEVIAGQGTIGTEILEDLPGTDLIIVPVGGGGLIAGIATAAKALRPGIRIVGVQAAACPSAPEAVSAGTPVRVSAQATIADGIRVAETGSRTFPVLRDLVDSIVLVSENNIADAMLLLLERKHIVAEGAGAAPLAALLGGSIAIPAGSTVVLVISGGNVDSAQLFRIVRQAMARQGRILRFSVMLNDCPGALAGLLSVIATQGGNIVHIDHTEGAGDVPVMMARVEIEVETRGREHADALLDAITNAGYPVTTGS